MCHAGQGVRGVRSRVTAFQRPQKVGPWPGARSTSLRRRSQNAPACRGLVRPLAAAQSVQSAVRSVCKKSKRACTASWPVGASRRHRAQQAARICSLAAGAAAAVRAGWSSYDTPDVDYTEAITDLGNPAAFYPVARRLERHIIAHLVRRGSGVAVEMIERGGRCVCLYRHQLCT